MTTTMTETTLWQRNLASLIRSGLFERAEVAGFKGLHAVVGVYGDGSHSAPLAKYADRRRAEDALAVVGRLSEPGIPAEAEDIPGMGNKRCHLGVTSRGRVDRPRVPDAPHPQPSQGGTP